MAIELVTYADLKSLLGLTDSAITDYPALGVIRDSVTAAFDTYLGRALDPIARTVTIYVGAQPTAIIKLNGVPISAVASVSVTILGDSESYTENEDYEVTGYGIRLLSKVKNCSIAITYTGGMTVVPDAVNRAALLQVAYEFQSKDQIGSESVSTDGGTVTRPVLGLLKEVQRLLDPHKHPLRW